MENFDQAGEDRRAFLGKFGKVALVAPPAISMLLSTSMSSAAIARSTGGPPSNHIKGNNGVGNGDDPQPPGNPKMNDGPGTGPGNPGSNGPGNGLANSGNQGHGHGHGH